MQSLFQFQRRAGHNHAFERAAQRGGNLRQFKKTIAKSAARAPFHKREAKQIKRDDGKQEDEQNQMISLLPFSRNGVDGGRGHGQREK